MTDITLAEPSAPLVFVRHTPSEALPPPGLARGPLGWIRQNLFADVLSSVLTILALALVVWIVPGLVRFLFVDAVWSAPNGVPCRAPEAGACWAFVRQKWPYFMYTSYPIDQRWRVDVTLAAGALLVAWLLWPKLPRKGLGGLLFFVVYPIAGFILLYGWPVLGS